VQERVGDDAAVAGRHRGHGVAVGKRHDDVAGDGRGVVEGGEAGEGAVVGGAGGAELEGGHEDHAAPAVRLRPATVPGLDL